jgi:hypothetical protein
MKEEIIKNYNREREERRIDHFEKLDKEDLECKICLELVKNPQMCATCETVNCLACIDRIEVCPWCRAEPYRYAKSNFVRRLVATVREM